MRRQYCEQPARHVSEMETKIVDFTLVQQNKEVFPHILYHSGLKTQQQQGWPSLQDVYSPASVCVLQKKGKKGTELFTSYG